MWRDVLCGPFLYRTIRLSASAVATLLDACAAGACFAARLEGLDLNHTDLGSLEMADLSEAIAGGTFPRLKQLVLSRNDGILDSPAVRALIDACEAQCIVVC